MPKIIVATDAYEPQVNGVVRCFNSIIPILEQRGYEVLVIHPNMFKTWPCPTYPEIRIARVNKKQLRKMIEDFDPDYIHIATEGTIGAATRKYCIKNKLQFSTSYHTKFPEYLWKMLKIPTFISYPYFRRFHSAAQNTLVTTESMKKELENRGFRNLEVWGRGVDQNIFKPWFQVKAPKPRLIYVGRVSKEKNIEAFLDMKIDAIKWVVGDGPYLQTLSKKYDNVHFFGTLKGDPLAQAFSQADAFVFPSKTDTFGIVIIEALACGAPVAAYNVTGPKDIITAPELGSINDDLETAVKNALRTGDRQKCVEFVNDNYTWEKSCDQFVKGLVSKNG